LVQAIKQQLEDAKQVVAKQSDQRFETTDSVNPIHRDLSLMLKQDRSVLAGLEARLAELQRQKESVAADLRTANEYDVKIDRLQRQADLARNKFFQYAQNLEEARMDQELENGRISNVSVLQAATFVEKPVSPNKAVVALGTLVVAIFGTASLVLASESLNDKLRNERDAQEALGVPVLGTIPDGRNFRRVFRTRTTTNGRHEPEVPPSSKVDLLHPCHVIESHSP
jgi:uncharacterized protein involved in exopolysaccharide biosynthesis